MALITTISEVMGMLGGIASLLWLSTYIEARQLGPVAVDAALADETPAFAPARLTVVEPVPSAA